MNNSEITIEQYLEKETKHANGYLYGVFPDTLNFWISDIQFNILFQGKAFDKGHFTDEVENELKKRNIEWISGEMRTELNIDEVKENILLDLKLLNSYRNNTINK